MALKVVVTHRVRIAGLDKPVSSGFNEKDRKQGGGMTEEDISGPPIMHTWASTSAHMCAHMHILCVCVRTGLQTLPL